MNNICSLYIYSRYYLQGHQQYRVCCYCPLKAVMYDDINEAFQVEDCVKNSSEKDEFGQILYPFCSCEAKMELTPRFIGKLSVYTNLVLLLRMI